MSAANQWPMNESSNERIPPAPWHLEGAAVGMLRSWNSVRCLVRYDASPVGPYREFVIAHATWRGPRVTTMLVSLWASRQGGRQIWGYPKEMAALEWRQNGARVEFAVGNRTWRARAFGPQFPMWLAGWTTQTLNARDVFVPFRLQGRARLAWCGRHLGVMLDTFQLKVLPPR